MQKADRDKLITDFASLIQRAGEKSEKFRSWNIFLDTIMPAILDVTRSFRNANWDLHLSAVRRALPLLFAFGRTNYSQWTPIKTVLIRKHTFHFFMLCSGMTTSLLITLHAKEVGCR